MQLLADPDPLPNLNLLLFKYSVNVQQTLQVFKHVVMGGAVRVYKSGLFYEYDGVCGLKTLFRGKSTYVINTIWIINMAAVSTFQQVRRPPAHHILLYCFAFCRVLI